MVNIRRYFPRLNIRHTSVIQISVISSHNFAIIQLFVFKKSSLSKTWWLYRYLCKDKSDVYIFFQVILIWSLNRSLLCDSMFLTFLYVYFQKIKTIEVGKHRVKLVIVSRNLTDMYTSVQGSTLRITVIYIAK